MSKVERSFEISAAADPVTLGLCSQIDLDLEVKRASKGTTTPDEADQGTMLLTAEEAMASANGRTGTQQPASEDGQQNQREEQIDADSVFSKLKSLKRDDDEE